jgi:hypothetical protein
MGIAAANIQGSTVFSLLSLMNCNLLGEWLHWTQMVMKDVKLLVINEYSFLSAATIDTLDHQLRKIFPQATHPFGGLNIVLCGCYDTARGLQLCFFFFHVLPLLPHVACCPRA